MSIVLNPYRRDEEWSDVFAELLPDDEIHLWPELGDPEEVEFVVAWRMPRAALAQLPNLRAILSLGAGAEQWQKDGMPDVPVVRLADPAMSNEMASYALHWVIHLQRRFDLSVGLQRSHRWEEPEYTQAWAFPVGILGYGTIGSRIGRFFVELGHPVHAWSRSGGSSEGVEHYAGLDELGDFLGASRAVVNVLPSTPETTGLLTRERFGQFAEDSIFVNIGRGSVVENEDDLVEAIDNGPLRAAVLDVTDPEPPAPDSPLFDHPAVFLTAHVAGSTQVRSAATLVADNIGRIRRGEEPFPLLDRARGY